MKIFNSWKEYDYSSGEFYLSNEKIRANHYGGGNTFVFIDLENALLTGKNCKRISLDYNWHEKGSSCLLFNYLNNVINGDIRSLFNLEETTEVFFNQNDKDFKITIYVSELKAINVFSPFNIDRVKPLKEIPIKMTVRHALRAIINDQVKNLKCNGVYTDDYAFDNAYNFQQGDIKNKISFAKDILENPSGWHVWQDSQNRQVYNLNCHTFDTNEFQLVI